MAAAYTLQLTGNATADLKRLDRTTATRIMKKMRWVALNAAVVEHTPLTGQGSGLYRWRVGDYRVIYALYEDKYFWWSKSSAIAATYTTGFEGLP